MIKKTKTDDTFDTFLAGMQESETTFAEIAHWYWELLEEYEGMDKALEIQEKRNDALENKCACLRNSQITKKMDMCNESG